MASKSLRFPLRARILIWSFVPTTIILFAVAITIYIAYQRLTEKLVVGRNEQLVRLSASELSADLAAYVTPLTTLTRTPDLYADDPTRQTAALQQNANQLLIFDAGALILDPRGKVMATEPVQPGLIGQDWSNQGFFRQILRNGGSAFSDILPGGVANPSVIAVSVPIQSLEGEFRGALVGLIRLGASGYSAFYGGIVKLRLGDGGNTYLVDSAGKVIYHPDSSIIGTDLHAQPVVQQVLKGQVGYLRAHNLDGRDILATYAPVPGTPWGLITEEDWAGLLAANQGYGQFLYVLLALGIIIPTSVVLFGVKRIIDPVARLNAAAKEIAGGKYGQQISVRTGDELEELGDQFNHMSAQLLDSYSQLEQRVAARTRELATLNAIAEVASQSLNLEEILRDALDQTLRAMGMEFGAAYVLEEQEHRMNLVAHCSPSGESVDQPGLRSLEAVIFEQATKISRPVILKKEQVPVASVIPWLEQRRIEQIVFVPLSAKGKLAGALILGSPVSRRVIPEEMSLLAAIGQQIGVAVENARLYQQAEETAAIAERTRLARELHDSVTQSLYSITLFAEASASLLDKGDHSTAVEHLRDLRDTSQEALREMRLLIYELRPPALEHNGLSAAIQTRLDSVEMRGGMKSELHVSGEEKLPLEIQKELYHIAQEALNNSLKHSHAVRVDVFLAYSEDQVQLEVCDNGRGFSPTKSTHGGLGLAGVRERTQRIGGVLSIESSPGKGTRVLVQVPLARQNQSELAKLPEMEGER